MINEIDLIVAAFLLAALFTVFEYLRKKWIKPGK